MTTFTAHPMEGRRLEEQVRLDLLKSALERNKLGQFATPPSLALSLARYAKTLLGDDPIRFLDPAIGTGSFFSAMLHTFPRHQIQLAQGIEIDPIFAETAFGLWDGEGLRIVEGDFTQQLPKPIHNLVLTNPPYVRHHHLSAPEKERLKKRLAQALQLEMSGLAGLYCYFLLLCHAWMEEQGLGIWLIPSEFMDVNYGITLRRYLIDRVTLLHIHRYCPTDVQFSDALVSSAVVVFRNAPPPAAHVVRFSFAGPIDAPGSEARVPLDTLRRSSKWTRFPETTTVREKAELTLGDIFSIKRGLATGSNQYFILNEGQVREWQIPEQALKPILPGPRYVTTDVIDALPDGAPDLAPRLFLLDCSRSEEEVKARWPRFYAYLQAGRESKIADSYLASHRMPWYSQEQRPPSPFLCTYMGRSRGGKHPFRFIWNRSNATAHNVYLMLYPKGPLLLALQKNPELEERVFQALGRITPSQLVAEGRVYGGGLHKVEPKELAQISAKEVLESVAGYVRIERQEKLFA